MSVNFAKRIDQFPPSGIRKVNEKAMQLEREGKKVIHLEIGRPDFDTPLYIKEACKKEIDNGNVFYTSNFGTMELRKAIADKLEIQNHVRYEPEEVIVTVGLTEAIFDMLTVILEEGDEILVPDPVWMNYINVPKMLGAVPVTYNLLEENDFQLDIDEIKSKITDKTKAIVIVSPNNPTGSMLSEDTLKKLAKLAAANDILVISDEVYERIVFDGSKHVSIASMPGMKERTILLNGFSKAFSMTGWRLGYLAAGKELIVAVNKAHQHITTCAPSFVQAAGVAALRDEKDEVMVQVREYERRRDYLYNELNKIDGINVSCPKGAFYAFVNMKELPVTCEVYCAALLDKYGVAVVPGTVFGSNGTGYFRLSFSNSYENIAEACNKIKLCTEEFLGRQINA